MDDVLLAETLGEDTTTQLYRRAAGGYRIVILALPPDGGEGLAPHQAPHVFRDAAISEAQARALFGNSGAKRHVEAGAAFAAPHA